MAGETSTDTEYKLITFGWWSRLMNRIPRPVFALGDSEIYTVMIHGSDFKLQLLEDGDFARGFFTTRWVAAKNFRDAEAHAIERVAREWRRRGFEAMAGSPTLRVEQISRLESRFRLRSGQGYIFYDEE